MDDDVFLRCIESNMLTDMTLQGIEQISNVRRVAIGGAIFKYKQIFNHKPCCLLWTHPVGVHASSSNREQEKDHHHRGGRV